MSSKGRRKVTVFTLALKEKSNHKKHLATKLQVSDRENAEKHISKFCLYWGGSLKPLQCQIENKLSSVIFLLKCFSVPVFMDIFLQRVPVGDFLHFFFCWVPKDFIPMLDFFLQSSPCRVAGPAVVNPPLCHCNPREVGACRVPSDSHDCVLCEISWTPWNWF